MASRSGRKSSRELILVAASDVFANRGLSGARVEDIIQKSGVNVRMLYHHFGNKEGLYAAVVEQLLSIQSLASERGEFDSPVNWLRHQHAKLVRFLWETPDSLAILAWELAEQRAGANENLGVRIISPLLSEPLAILLAEGTVKSSKSAEELAALLIHQAAYTLRMATSGQVQDLQEKGIEKIIEDLWTGATRDILVLSPHLK